MNNKKALLVSFASSHGVNSNVRWIWEEIHTICSQVQTVLPFCYSDEVGLLKANTSVLALGLNPSYFLKISLQLNFLPSRLPIYAFLEEFPYKHLT